MIGLSLLAVAPAMAQFNISDPVGTVALYELKELGSTHQQTMVIVEKEGNKMVLNVSSNSVEAVSDVPQLKTIYHYSNDRITTKLEDRRAQYEQIINMPNTDMGRIKGFPFMPQFSVRVKGDDFFLPLRGKVGEEFKPTEQKFSISISGTPMDGVAYGEEIRITSAKIIGEEQLELPAGTFQTIIFEREVERISSSLFSFSTTTKSKETYWISAKYGVVKTHILERGEGDDPTPKESTKQLISLSYPTKINE